MEISFRRAKDFTIVRGQPDQMQITPTAKIQSGTRDSGAVLAPRAAMRF